MLLAALLARPRLRRFSSMKRALTFLAALVAVTLAVLLVPAAPAQAGRCQDSCQATRNNCDDSCESTRLTCIIGCGGPLGGACTSKCGDEKTKCDLKCSLEQKACEVGCKVP
jgi:hypothetical protein